MALKQYIEIILKPNKNVCEYSFCYGIFFNLLNFWHFFIDYDFQNKIVKVKFSIYNIFFLIAFILSEIFLLRWSIINHYTYTYIEFIEFGNSLFTVIGIALQILGALIELKNYKLFEELINDVYDVDMRVSF